MTGARKMLLLGLALGLCLGGGLLLFLGPGLEIPVPSPSPPGLEPGLEAAPLPEPLEPPPVEPAEPEQARAVSEEGGPQHGTIVGELQIEADESLPPISKFWIYLQEARNPALGSAQTFVREFHYQEQGGRFLLPQVPFGAWRVSVVVQEMVGSEVIRVLRPEEPLARVVLTVKKGRDLPVYVNDPERRPLDAVDVLLHPIGDPPGRRVLAAKTDGLGSATFRNVLGGEYELQVGPKWQLLAQPMRIQVGPIEPRFVRYEIPMGGDFQVTVLAPGGYPVAGAECKLISFQTPRYREFQATADKLGIAAFGKVPQGQYQLRIQATGFDVKIQTSVEIVENQENRREVYLDYAPR